MREWFKKDLVDSDFIRKPLRLHPEETREARCLQKTPLHSVLLDDMTSLASWEAVGPYAQLELSRGHARPGGLCANSVKFSSVTRLDHWPKAFGRIYTVPAVLRKVDHGDWRHINRVSCWVYPDMPGFYSVSFRMQFHNGGSHPVPDRYDREGHHNVNLVHGQWQYVSVEIPYLHRDRVTGLSFEYDMVGSEVTATGTACWYITDITLETLAEEDLDLYEGWRPKAGRIAFSGSGYMPGAKKTAIANLPEARGFKLIETATGRTVLEKAVETNESPEGGCQTLDFSEIDTPGEYLIVCGGAVSRSFPIGGDVWEDSIWKGLNFLFCQRCGFEVPGKHYVCHRDVTVRHGNLSIVANGGWHDAGDMTQTTTNTAECTYALFELLGKLRDNGPLYKRVLEEAAWGLDWLLKTRFGDGYRVPSSSKSCWTNGILGDQDDIYREAALETIENFMCAGAEALAARALRATDPVLAAYSLRCAREDWAFAYANREAEDFCKQDDPNRICTYLLKYAAATWSAADLFEATGESYYADMAVACGDAVLACQCQTTAGWDTPYIGFFYDTPEHRLIAHYSHRSHENEPLKALARLAELFPGHENYGKWMYAVALYGEYIQKASEATAPYHVAPASIYHQDEAFHSGEYDLGMIQRYLTDEERRENYRVQVRAGVPLGQGYFLRRMPVAFEHRGNHAVTLAAGKAVSTAARLKNSLALSELALRQLEWIVGRNPFAESVMFGEGYDYCQEYAVLPGEAVGELGVGFACLDEHDSPFWPQVNTCVYKEVWIKSVLHWLWLAADFCGEARVEGQVPPGQGPVEFTNRDTGAAHTVTPCANSGWYAAELPAGPYTAAYAGREVSVTLLPASTCRLDAPFRDLGLRAEKTAEGRKVVITAEFKGQGECVPRWTFVNLQPDTAPGPLAPGKPQPISCAVADRAKPYYAAVSAGPGIQVREVYGWV